MGRKSRMKKERRAGIAIQPVQDNSQSLDQKVLILVAGLPYSGKTTFARYLSQSKGYPIIEGDASDLEYIQQVNSSPEARGEFASLIRQYGEEKAMSIMGLRFAELHARYVVESLKSNSGVIAESVGLVTQSERTFLINTIKRQTDAAVEIYWIDTDLETCLQRYNKAHQATQNLWLPRGAGPLSARDGLTEPFLRQIYIMAQLPNPSEGFNKIFYVKAISPGQYEIREQPVNPATR